MFESRGSLVAKTPLQTSTTLFPRMSTSLSAWAMTAYGDIYTRHLWVYVVVNKRANGVARLPLKVYRREALNRPTADDHPMAKLLAQPNPVWSTFDLWFWVSAMKDTYGEAFLLKARPDGSGSGISALWPLHPSSMTWDDKDGIWRYDSGRLRMTVKSGDVMHFKNFNPVNSVRGLSPLEPLRATLENEWSARSATSAFWRGGARPGTILSHPQRISEGAMRRLKAQYDEAAGGADKVGATIVLEEGMEPKIVQVTAEEAQYIETRRLNREEVCGAYDMPPPAVHILDRATFSNITEQLRSLYRDTLGPMLKSFESVLMTDLKAAEWPADNVYAEFLMDDVLRGDFEQRQDALNKANHMTIAEKRRIENLPFIDGTDRIFLNTATLPLDAIDAQTAAAVRSVAGVAEEKSGVLRTVLGRLSWQESLSEVDALKVADGLDEMTKARVVLAVLEVSDAGGTVADLRQKIKEAA